MHSSDTTATVTARRITDRTGDRLYLVGADPSDPDAYKMDGVIASSDSLVVERARIRMDLRKQFMRGAVTTGRVVENPTGDPDAHWVEAVVLDDDTAIVADGNRFGGDVMAVSLCGANYPRVYDPCDIAAMTARTLADLVTLRIYNVRFQDDAIPQDVRRAVVDGHVHYLLSDGASKKVYDHAYVVALTGSTGKKDKAGGAPTVRAAADVPHLRKAFKVKHGGQHRIVPTHTVEHPDMAALVYAALLLEDGVAALWPDDDRTRPPMTVRLPGMAYDNAADRIGQHYRDINPLSTH
jgi:hypothetical protein